MFALATTSTCAASAKFGGVATGLGVGLAVCEGCGDGLAARELDGDGAGVGEPFADGVEEPPPLQATNPSEHAKNPARIPRYRIGIELSWARLPGLWARVTSPG
jgi:hypothetical protein